MSRSPQLRQWAQLQEGLQNMIETAFNIHEENRLRHLIDDEVEKKVLDLFKEAHENELNGIYIKLYQTVERTTAKAIYFGEAGDIINTKFEKLAKSQHFMKHIIHQLTQSPTFPAPVTRLVK